MNLWQRLTGRGTVPDTRAQAFEATISPGFNAASVVKRFARWITTPADLNTILSSEGEELRRRSRNLCRNNPHAANAIDSFVGNCVGTGIKPQSLHPDPAMRQNLQEWWLRWTDEADSAGLTDYYGLQSLACRGVMEAGEVLLRIRPRRLEDGLTAPLQLQILEAEHLPLSETKSLPNGFYVRNGIEFDGIGRRTAYYLYRQHPGSAQVEKNDGNELVRVPASSVLHVYKPLRPGQIRGYAWLATVIAKLYELEQYADAELVRKKTAAMITHFITELSPENPLILGTPDQPDADSTPVAVIEAGSTVKLLPGEDVRVSQAPDISGIEFIRSELRSVAAGIGLADFQLSGDMTQVNYSSARIALLEFRRRCEQFQHQVMSYQMNRPVWRAFIEACVMAGLIPAGEYQRNKARYLAVLWRPPKWDWVDPLKDINAEIAAINARLKSRSQTIHDLGEDPETVDRMIAEDQERLEELGVAPPVTGSAAQAGKPPVMPEEPQPQTERIQ